jgi:DNA-directed RNA polymerase subunit M/transcription elongation factor TFIIS
MNWAKQSDKGCRKEWHSERSRYRITWRNRVFGVSVAAGFQSCVRAFVTELNRPIWELVDRKRPLYRTLQTAKNACEKHNDPSYKPVRRVSSVKHPAPVKLCPECGASLHARKRLCECGYNFPRSVKSMRKSAEKKAKKAAKKKAAKAAKKKTAKKKVAKKAREAPLKTCPQCNNKLPVRKAVCDCGYNFPRKAER